MILLSSTEDMVANSVEKPRGLTRWIDLYASADPVPNGPTMLPAANAAGAPSAEVESVLIWNRGAMLSDHTTYWDNLDGFVLRIARVCAETAKSPWQRKLPDATQMSFADRLAKWRVGFLRWAVRINTLFWLLAFSLLWWRHEARVPLPIDLPAWLPAWAPIAARAAMLAFMMAVAAWATAALLRWPWIRWVRAEQELMLAAQESVRHGVGLVGAHRHRDGHQPARVLGLAARAGVRVRGDRTARRPVGRPAHRDDDRGLQFRGDRILAQAATGAASRSTNSAMMPVGRSTKSAIAAISSASSMTSCRLVALSDRTDVRFHVGDRGMSGPVVLSLSFVANDPKRTSGLKSASR